MAETVLADVNFAVHSSNGELARRAGVSEPTVTRFSRAVGCGGVRELKVKLAQSMVVGRIYLDQPPHVGTAQAKPALWRSVFEEIRRAIAAVEQQLRPEDVEKAAEAIANCTRLVAFGVSGCKHYPRRRPRQRLRLQYRLAAERKAGRAVQDCLSATPRDRPGF